MSSHGQNLDVLLFFKMWFLSACKKLWFGTCRTWSLSKHLLEMKLAVFSYFANSMCMWTNTVIILDIVVIPTTILGLHPLSIPTILIKFTKLWTPSNIWEWLQFGQYGWLIIEVNGSGALYQYVFVIDRLFTIQISGGSLLWPSCCQRDGSHSCNRTLQMT